MNDGNGRTARIRSVLGRTCPTLVLGLIVLASTACSNADHENPREPQPASAGVCDFLKEVESIASEATTISEGLAALQQVRPQLKQLAKDAPEDDRADLRTLAAAAKRSVKTANLEAMASDEVAAAGSRLSARCN